MHGRLTNNMHRVNISMIPNGVLPYGVQAANARFRVAPARTIEVRHKAGRRPRIDGEHLKLCSLTFVLFLLPFGFRGATAFFLDDHPALLFVS